MTAMHLSRTRAPCKDHCAWVGVMLIATSSPILAAEPAEPAETSTDPPITAVYKAQELSFNYRSSNRYYSCHDIEQRVAVILVGVGARDDIDVKARNCESFMAASGDTSMDIDPTFGRNSNDPLGRDRSDPFGRGRDDPFGRNRSGSYGRADDDRQQTASVRIRMMMPVELTPQVHAEIEKDRSRRELVSRVTRNPAASMNDPVVFAARRQDVTLSQKTIKLKAEDCDLLQQVTTQVIRRLDVRVKNQSFGCGPRTSSRIPPQLTVEALVPTGQILPMPDPEKDKKAKPPASNEPEASNPETQASESASQ
jgi:hypothetical protein